jgi:lysophospholipase L1-like esterase
LATGFISSHGAGLPDSYPDPARFEKAIEQFEAEDRINPPPQGAVLCIGSSSMRMWHDMIEEDLAPLTLIKRGFGGSNMNDVLHYADRIVIPYMPRAIVLYEGDNDVAKGVPPAKIHETFRAFAGKVHAAIPECRIYVLSIKPSVKRWTMWSDMQEANRLIAMDCAKDERMTFVDISKVMLAADGTPKPEIFKEDQLHMNRNGYEIWRDTLKPVLMKNEIQLEAKQTVLTLPDSLPCPDEEPEQGRSSRKFIYAA